jgi:putative ABC transport system permease protein
MSAAESRVTANKSRVSLLGLAWRESRSTRRKLLLYMSSISLGVAALVAIDSFAGNITRSVRSPLNWLARYWSLVGLALRYSYFALRGGNAERLQGLLDGLRAASGNKLLWPGSFKAGPLDH